MTDPFVQRMMARTQARRNALAATTNNKENLSSIRMNLSPNKSSASEISTFISSNVEKSPTKPSIRSEQKDEISTWRSRSPIKESSALRNRSPIKESSPARCTSTSNANTTSLGSRSPIKEFSPLRNRSPIKEASPLRYTSTSSANMTSRTEDFYDGQSTSVSSSSSRRRFHLLASRSQQMKEWEDDYTYHSKDNSAKVVNKEMLSENTSSLHAESSPERNSYLVDSVTATACKGLSNRPSKWSMPSSSIETATELNQCPYSVANLPATPKAVLTPACSRTSSASFISSKANSPIMTPSPTRKLAWDKKLLSSLEAQGFTPTESKSRLFYDFEKNSEKKPVGISAIIHKSAERDCQMNDRYAPKIVSVMSKNNSFPKSNDAQDKKESNSSSKLGKVGNLKSQWEEHIRNASPERTSSSRTPSPDRRRPPSASVLYNRSPSPVRQYLFGTSEGFPRNRMKKEFSEGKVGSKTNNRSSASDVIKGEAPMPDVTPVVTNPSASVKERAAAFASVMGKAPERKVDPTELSVQDRRNMFEKKRSEALVPIAPFGQSIPMPTSTSKEHDFVVPPPPPPPSIPVLTFEENSPASTSSPQSYSSFSPPKHNSTEIEGSRGHLAPSRSSPKKPFVPRIKPGCLFPSLSDIESQSSESIDSQSDDENRDSSFVESVLTCSSVESLGLKIQRISQNNNNDNGSCASAPPLPSIHEDENLHPSCVSMSESTMEALDAIDDAINEAFDDNEGPTPPKRTRYEDDEGVKCKPIQKIIRCPEISFPSNDPPVSPSVTIGAQIRRFQEEEGRQLNLISQASSAMGVVDQRPEDFGSSQHVEAERLLLISTQKRQTLLNEIQRLKAEGALGKSNQWGDDVDSSRGSISISKITVPLKREFLDKQLNAGIPHHLLVLVKQRDQVIISEVLTTPDCVREGAIVFPNLMALHDLSANFNIALEVYCFRAELPYSSMKKKQSRLKLTPLKRLQRESRIASPSVQSPGGPSAVRSTSFALIGFAHLNINTLTRNAWTLEKVPYHSPLDGHLLMKVTCTMEGGVTVKSFLTMFEDVGGLGSWNRRWCVLKGPFLRYWRYPDDESKKDCMGYIDLRSCTNRVVELVSRDLCARQHTIQLDLLRPAMSSDRSNLVQEIKRNAVITKIMLSADSKEERLIWCKKLSKALANIRAWDPDALRPEDYVV